MSKKKGSFTRSGPAAPRTVTPPRKLRTPQLTAVSAAACNHRIGGNLWPKGDLDPVACEDARGLVDSGCLSRIERDLHQTVQFVRKGVEPSHLSAPRS
jgi:hypothetical protein